MEYKKVKLALSAQYILSKTKMEEDDDGIKKIKYIKVSKNVVPFSDIIFFLLDKDGIDFTLYEKEKGCKAEKINCNKNVLDKLKNCLEENYGIKHDYECYAGIHIYDKIDIKEVSFDEEKEEYTVSFDFISKKVTEDAYGMDLGGWNDGIRETHLTAQINKHFAILSVDKLEEENEFEK